MVCNQTYFNRNLVLYYNLNESDESLLCIPNISHGDPLLHGVTLKVSSIASAKALATCNYKDNSLFCKLQ